jgi:tetratricopeptide (TPR) repeat protein
MPLFGTSRRPKLDGLTRDEERRRDALNPEVLRRAGEGGVAGQGPAALAVLRERTEAEPNEFLWPCLLGWQYMSMRRFAPAITAFSEAVRRDDSEVRGYYGAGAAYFDAAEGKLARGAATTDDTAPEDLTVDNLYHESLRNFRRALELTNDKGERDQLRQAIAAVEKAVARKAGRL